MKNPILMALLLGALLPSCSAYTSPLCDESNRKDIPNFEGHFTTVFSFVSKEGSLVDRKSYTVSRAERGSYFMESRDGTGRMSTCEIEGNFYAEDNRGWNSGLPNAGYVAFQVVPMGDGSFDFVGLGIDSKVLDSQKIPYKLIEIKGNDSFSTPNGQLFALLVDNSGVPRDQFVQLLDPISLKFTLQPQSN